MLGVVLIGVITVSASATVVHAHDPIIIEDDQTSPEIGPFLPDGTVSFALYGRTSNRGDTRSFRVQFAEGDPLHVSLLIPDVFPENTLADEDLPYLQVVDPSGSTTTLKADRRIAFAEPFTGTNYIRLVEEVDVARAGVYTITVVGGSPARFTVSVGFEETFGTPVDGVRDRAVGVDGVMAWYNTPPAPPVDPEANAPSTTAQGDVAAGNSSPSDPSQVLVVIVWIVGVVALMIVGRGFGETARRHT